MRYGRYHYTTFCCSDAGIGRRAWLAGGQTAEEYGQGSAEAQRHAQQAALVDGVKSLLRGQIIDDGLRYMEQKSIPPFALDTMEQQYDAYVRLGDGDKSVNDLVDGCKKLPIRSGGK